ncbi:MAG: hypothetical protein RLZZ127_2582 [Planctomycetota bacterium]|jgi:hypothetical protein
MTAELATVIALAALAAASGLCLVVALAWVVEQMQRELDDDR